MTELETAPFAGKVAVITGGAQGIGEASARLMARRGAKALVLVDRQADRLEAVAADLKAQGVAVMTVAADLADAEAVARVIPAADAAFGRVDILANIAGLTERGGILDSDVALFDRMMAVNVRAPFFLMQDAIRLMMREGAGGAIVNILSVNAHVGGANLAPYSASKGALATLSKNVANAVNYERIRVNGILLGWAETPGEHETLKRFHNAQPDWAEKAAPSRPFGRLINSDDVARMVAFLAGPESFPMTGSNIDFEQSVFGGNAGAMGMAGYPVASKD
ncbi:SDR family oxidoreductase [Devosia sp.]|uniref:SDR family oxidoreductase n=1 Tax=Devosia sp. TaxID=1871048 RepID=UPI003A8CA089